LLHIESAFEYQVSLNFLTLFCFQSAALVFFVLFQGKTVEAIAGAILRNVLSKAKEEKPRPCVIVTPNDAVSVQWRDTLYKNGVAANRIKFFEKGQTSVGFDQDIFLLLTRHRLQAEVKRVFGGLDQARDHPEMARSALFPHVDIDNLLQLKTTYEEEHVKGAIRENNPYRKQGESIADCITRKILLCQARMKNNKLEPAFSTVLIDESHFLKNLATFWGIGAALVGAHSYRSLPITGTPYNNNVSDLAAMMTFVDPAKDSARRCFWEDKTSGYDNNDHEAVTQRFKIWRDHYLVRRLKDSVLKSMVNKTEKQQLVSQYVAEQLVYEYYEGMLQEVLREFGNALDQGMDNPLARAHLKQLFTKLMAIMSNLLSSNIHAMVPNGREFTKQFSPTRCHLLKEEQHPRSCVCCDQKMRSTIPVVADKDKVNGKRSGRMMVQRRRALLDTEILEEGEEYSDNDDGDMLLVEEDEELSRVPFEFCSAAREGDIRHYAHEECIALMKQSNESCPRCQHAKNTMQYKLPNGEDNMYCQQINGGFSGSSKINAVVEHITTKVPANDKVVVFSNFKGGLDLLEGIFHYDLGVDCARFDGDLDRQTKLEELERFKKDPKCKVLLTTIGSASVGLNIVEANPCCFLIEPLIRLSMTKPPIGVTGLDRPKTSK